MNLKTSSYHLKSENFFIIELFNFYLKGNNGAIGSNISLLMFALYYYIPNMYSTITCNRKFLTENLIKNVP